MGKRLDHNLNCGLFFSIFHSSLIFLDMFFMAMSIMSCINFEVVFAMFKPQKSTWKDQQQEQERLNGKRSG